MKSIFCEITRLSFVSMFFCCCSLFTTEDSIGLPFFVGQLHRLSFLEISLIIFFLLLLLMFNNDILYPSWFDEFFRKCYDKQKVMKSIFFAEQLDFLSYNNKYPWNLNAMSVL